jgi:hypothetical protein
VPAAEELIRSAPPDASAVRRAMSSPRPVEPAPLRPRSIAASGRPGPVSETETSAPPPGRGRTVTRNGVPSGVCEDVAEQRIEGSAEVAGRYAHGKALLAEAHGHGPLFLLGQDRPEAHALGHHGRGVAADAQPLSHGPARLRDHLVDAAGQCVDVVEHPLAVAGRQRLGVQAQGGQRRPQPVGQVGRGLPLGGEQFPDPAGQPVDRRTDLPHLGGAGGGDPGGQVAAAQAVCRGRQVGDRPGQRPGQPVGDEQRQEQQHGTEAGEDQPRPRHACPQPLLRDEDLDQRRLGAPLDRLEQSGPVVAGLDDGGRGNRVVVAPAVAEPLAVDPPHGHAEVSGRADQARHHLVAVGQADGRREELHLGLSGVQGPRLGDPGDEGCRGQQEGEQHDRRRRRHQQGDLASHGSGSASRTPTPRTVCSSRGSAPLSPSLRRSQDRWTSTVLSEPP